MARSIIPKGGNDEVYTPPELAQQIVDYFSPYKNRTDIRVMEPCYGEGAFVNACMNNFYHFTDYGHIIDYCDINKGIDFLKFPNPENSFIPYRYDYIITNPPFSKFRAFLNKSMDISNNVIFLSLINAFFFKARLKDIKDKGFGFKEIVFVDTPPKPWPQFGIQLGVVHLQKDYKGDTKFTYGLS